MPGRVRHQRDVLVVTSTQLQAGRRVDASRVLIAIAPLLAFGVFALLQWGDWGKPRDAEAIGGETELLIWKGLITAQVLVWTVLAGIGLRALHDLGSHVEAWLGESVSEWRARWRAQTLLFVLFVYSVLALLIVLGAFAEGTVRNPVVLHGLHWKVIVVFVLGGLAILPFLIVLKRVQLCAAERRSWSTRAGDIERIRVLRARLRTATASLGTVIALYMVSSGALSDAVDAAALPSVSDSLILVAGAWFTGVLAALYLYVFTAVDGRARRLLERAAPLPDPSPSTATEFTGAASLRRDLSAELELGGDARQNLEGLIAVFSPLGAALLSRFAGL